MKKRMKVLGLIVLFLILLVTINLENVHAYSVSTCGDLQNINNGHLSDNIVLYNDINCGGATLTPIGTGGAGLEFKGTFDGQGHIIRNFNIVPPVSNGPYESGCGGLFLVISGTVRNVGIESAYVSVQGNSQNGYANAGVLACSLSKTGLIEKSYSKGTVIVNAVYPNGGGLVGSSAGEIRNSYSQASVTSNGNWRSAGLLGTMGFYGKISNSYATGALGGTAPAKLGILGGIVDPRYGSYVTGAYWDKDTTGTTQSIAGTPKSTSQMKQQGTFSGWDFSSIWCMPTNDYPRLKWEAGCGCIPEPISITCAGKTCGTTNNNCGQPVNCPQGCNDNDICTIDICSSYTCSNTPKCSPGEYCQTSTGDCITKSSHICSSANDIILKLIGPRNSLATIWDEPDTDSNYQICYSEIFGTYIGTNPFHNCIGTNKVLGLKTPIKSLVQIPSYSDYPTIGNVCYGDLICRTVHDYINSSVSYIQDFSLGIWHYTKVAPFEIKGIAGNVHGGVVILGVNNQLKYLDNFNNDWNSITSPPFNLLGITSEDIRNGIFAFGGTKQSAFIAYPYSGSWTSIASPGFDIHGACGENSGGVIVFGGANNQQVSRINNYAVGNWVSMSSPGFEIKGITGNMNGGIVVFGGNNQLKYRYDFTDSGRYEPVTTPSFNVIGITSEDIRNGIIAFGNDSSGNYHLERIDHPFSGSWYVIPLPNFKLGDITGENSGGIIAYSYEKDKIIGDCDSSSNEKTVVRLQQENNSRVSDSSDLSFTAKICCKPSSTTPTSLNLYWANMTEKPISQTDLKDRVKLIAEGSSLIGRDLYFDIYEVTRGLFGWLIPDKHVTTTTSKGITTWVANVSGDYYFTVTVDGNTYNSKDNPASNPYGTLHVTNFEKNNAPFAKIDNPKIGEIYGLTDTISFNQSSYDEDNYINYVWNFGDGNSASGSTRTYVFYNLTYIYQTGELHSLSPFGGGTSSDGQKNVLLSVTDERGLNVEDMVSILVVDRTAIGKIYVFANILKPVWDEEIPPTQEFDATGSYVIKVNDTGGLECLAGDCPSGYDIGNIPITGPDYSLLSFTWKFNDETPDIPPLEGNPKYTKSFGINGKGIVNLTVTYNNSEKSSTYVEVKINPGGPGGKYCLNGVWYEGGTTYSTTEPNNKCKGLDPLITTDDCCPGNGFYSCLENTTMPAPHMFQCMLTISEDNYCTQNSISSCSDYDEPHCVINDMCNKGTQSCGSGSMNNFCGEYGFATNNPAHCRCEWNGTNCNQNRSYTLTLSGINIEGSCSIQILSAGECQDGEMSVSQNSQESWQNLGDLQLIDNTLNTPQKQLSWVNANCRMSDICFTGNRGIICGEDTIRLGFFNSTQFVITLLLVMFIYLIYIIYN